MPTLHLTRGLPASGKSTWARALVASRRPGSILRVNRDDLRRSMADPAYSTPVDAVERRISAAEWQLVRSTLLAGVDVVVDATNLRAAVARRWLALAEACGACWHVEDVVADLEECIRRDAARNGPEHVGEDTLRDLHARYLDPVTGRPAPLAPPPRLSSAGGAPYRPVPGTPSAVLVVVEGVLAQADPPDPDHPEDVPVAAAVEVLAALAAAGHRVVALSARPEEERAAVTSWLARRVPVPVDTVLLRPPGRRRGEDAVALGLFDAHVRDRYTVVAVVEGRPRRAARWRGLGLTVLGLAEPGT
ncbi:AAA family ATPase [Actinomycetospora cinnamomea]|uniref:Putative kinase n=1 Tax=Actinomycetospora cinnamomea TaxID=663609 RepID=A0A2U1FPN2_9PSEU|nr:AAA family ATPase [Actinomycetospora cinnamomea]PVZ14153.1 putative kinase [Actinomycetospora cinnamomea]